MDEKNHTPESAPVPALSVVIPSFRSDESLATVLSALARELDGQSCEILVVDSTGDGQAARTGREYPSVSVIETPRRLSGGAARNYGAERARAAFILFLDADCVPGPGWGQRVRQALSRRPALQSGAIANGTPNNLAGTLQYWIEFARFTRWSRPGQRPFVPSYQVLIDKALFLASPRYLETFLVAEDVVLSAWLRQRVTDFRFDPEMEVFHLNRRTLREVIRHLFRLGRGSGRARLLIPGLRGSFLTRFPPLAMGLVPYRWFTLVRGLAPAEGLSRGRKTLLALLFGPGLAIWCAGLATGSVRRLNTDLLRTEEGSRK